jgi:MarR family transcriptional regulator, organic hydroperoxide resistance regulator
VDQKLLEQYINRLEQSIFTSMRKLGPELSDQLEQGLTGDQYYVLKILQQEKKCTASYLAETFRVKPSAITAMIDRMIKNDFVSRERDEEDRRVIYIKMTERGSDVLEMSEKKRSELIERYISKLDQEDLESIVTVYEKLAKIIQGEN